MVEFKLYFGPSWKDYYRRLEEPLEASSMTNLTFFKESSAIDYLSNWLAQQLARVTSHPAFYSGFQAD